MKCQKKYQLNIPAFRTARENITPLEDVGDLRFRKLLNTNAWHGLPPAVRARFSKRLSGTKSAIYTGEIVETRLSRLGWAFAQVARMIPAYVARCQRACGGECDGRRSQRRAMLDAAVWPPPRISSSHPQR